MKNLATIVTKEQVMAALKYIDENQIPLRSSTGFDLVYNNKSYPPKEVVRTAARLSGITDLSQYRLNGGPPTNDSLQKMGFTIQQKGIESAIPSPHQLMDILVAYLDRIETGTDFGNYKYQEKSSTIVFGGLRGLKRDPQINPGYIFSNSTASWLFRFIKINEDAYIVVENVSKMVQLANYNLVSGHTFINEGGITYLKENYSITVNTRQPIETAKAAMLQAGFADNDIILSYEDADVDEQEIITNLLEWAEIRQKAKDIIRNNEALAEGEEENNHNSNNIPYLNTILFGPPGTGKTFTTINKALEIVDPVFYHDHKDDREKLTERFRQLQIKDWASPQGKIGFVTFHQNSSYQDFVEGIKPELIENAKGEKEDVTYEIKDGIFKLIAQKASWRKGNFDKVFDAFKESINEEKDKKPLTIKSKGTTFDVVYRETTVLYVQPKGSIKQDPWYPVNIVNIRKVYETGSYEGVYNPTYVREILKHLREERGLVEPKQNTSETPEPHVLIIDEINRGNVAEIFGELITLLEPDKRVGETEELEVMLPYSKIPFGVPANLFIIGTMNTADRGVEALDTALRRRFYFEEMPPEPAQLKKMKINDPVLEQIDFVRLLENINTRIETLHSRDNTIGHAYFINIRTLDDLKHAFFNKIIPLLQEYFYKDYGRIGLVLGESFLKPQVRGDIQLKPVPGYDFGDLHDGYVYHIKKLADFVADEDFVKAVKAIYE